MLVLSKQLKQVNTRDWNPWRISRRTVFLLQRMQRKAWVSLMEEAMKLTINLSSGRIDMAVAATTQHYHLHPQSDSHCHWGGSSSSFWLLRDYLSLTLRQLRQVPMSLSPWNICHCWGRDATPILNGSTLHVNSCRSLGLSSARLPLTRQQTSARYVDLSCLGL